jgi:copper chaperone CopZ
METTEYTVNGMTCGHCVLSVREDAGYGVAA